MKTVGIHTLGCRVNQYESVALAEELTRRGFRVCRDEEVCDYYLINTCAVTAESQRQSRQTVRRFAARGRTAVLGCASQLAKEEFLSIPQVFYVGGCSDKCAVVDAIQQDVADRVWDAVGAMAHAPYESMSVEGGSDLFSSCRAYIKIQDGCSGHCSYCIIPTLRGPSRSRPAADVLAEAERLAAAGYREVVLTGIETSAYSDEPLWKLIDQLSALKARGLKRVRLGSLSPGSVQGEFLRAAAASENFMPHVHLSLQSGSNRILKQMRRPYTREYALERVALLRQAMPNVQVSADFITGFPTETEAEYEESETFVRQANLFHVHAFPFSPREGTPAANMEGAVPVEERKQRCSRLNAVAHACRDAILDTLMGKPVVVLVEKQTGEMAVGHTEEFLECTIPTAAAVGDLVVVTVAGHANGKLIGMKQERKEEIRI